MRRALRYLAVLAAVASVPAIASADDVARLRVLESERRALQVRLDGMERAAERDFLLRDLRQRALDRARKVDARSLEEGAFLLLRRPWFQKMVEAVTPVELVAGGFKWRCDRPDVQLEPDGIAVTLRFKTISRELRKRFKHAVEGTLKGVLHLDRAETGQFVLRYSALDLVVDDEHFRAATMLYKAVRMADFEGVVAGFAVPLAPASSVACCGKKLQMKIGFSPDRVVVFRGGVVVPFTVEPGAVSAHTPPPPPAPADPVDASTAGSPEVVPAPRVE